MHSLGEAAQPTSSGFNSPFSEPSKASRRDSLSRESRQWRKEFKLLLGHNAHYNMSSENHQNTRNVLTEIISMGPDPI